MASQSGSSITNNAESTRNGRKRLTKIRMGNVQLYCNLISLPSVVVLSNYCPNPISHPMFCQPNQRSAQVPPLSEDGDKFGKTCWVELHLWTSSGNQVVPGFSSVLLLKHIFVVECDAHMGHYKLWSMFQIQVYKGHPDRQGAVFRWLVVEMFCSQNAPLKVDKIQFEVITRSFR